MQIPHLHDWPATEEEAVALQQELAPRVDVSAPLGRFGAAPVRRLPYMVAMRPGGIDNHIKPLCLHHMAQNRMRGR